MIHLVLLRSNDSKEMFQMQYRGRFSSF